MDCELVFVIPLKSAKVASDWELTQKLLRSTLACVNSQPGSRAIVVCNEVPDVEATIVEADFQIADKTVAELRYDKMRKCHLGLQHAARFSPKRAMLLDADDLLHRDFVQHVTRFDPSVGLIARHGYRYTLGSRHLRRSSNYHNISASSMVFPYTPEVGPEYSDYYMTRQNHVKPIETAFRAQGIPYQYLRFPAGIYLRGSNDSIRDVCAIEQPGQAAGGVLQWKRVRTIFRKAMGRSFRNVEITDELLRNFPGLAAHAAAEGT
jgi:hypothetical protein